MTVTSRTTVCAAVDKAMADNPLADLADAIEIAAERLGLSVEAVTDAVTLIEEKTC